MRKIFICALVCASMCSCTKESYFDIENGQVTETFSANSATFDEEENNFILFTEACKSLIETHKEFDCFREVLSESSLQKIDSGKYDNDTAVAVIYRWWENDQTFDVMVEWPAWDDFKNYLPEKYYSIYSFAW